MSRRMLYQIRRIDPTDEVLRAISVEPQRFREMSRSEQADLTKPHRQSTKRAAGGDR
jgi:hypothetical protein